MLLKNVITYVVIVVLAYYWLNYIKRGPVYRSNKSLAGKTVLITGGNTGIGKAIAIEFAKRDAKVIIASRNVEKSEIAKVDIIKETGNEQIRSMYLDLIDFDSVRSFAKEFDESEQYLDFLINNAGVLALTGKTSFGVNKIFTVNHLGPFLLTNLLLDKMKSQSDKRPVRIINLSSLIYRWGSITNETMYEDVTSVMDMYKAYGCSKVATIFFTAELHRRLKNYQITTYVNHPGFVASGIGDPVPLLYKLSMHTIPLILSGRDVYYGAQTTMYCALDDNVTNFSGGFFIDCGKVDVLEHAVNETMEKYLWEESSRLTGLV